MKKQRLKEFDLQLAYNTSFNFFLWTADKRAFIHIALHVPVTATAKIKEIGRILLVNYFQHQLNYRKSVQYALHSTASIFIWRCSTKNERLLYFRRLRELFLNFVFCTLTDDYFAKVFLVVKNPQLLTCWRTLCQVFVYDNCWLSSLILTTMGSEFTPACLNEYT